MTKIVVRLHEERDADLIEWWTQLKSADRGVLSATIRGTLRAGIIAESAQLLPDASPPPATDSNLGKRLDALYALMRVINEKINSAEFSVTAADSSTETEKASGVSQNSILAAMRGQITSEQ